MRREVVGEAGEGVADLLQPGHLDGGLAALVAALAPAHAGPAAVKPVGLVGAVFPAGLELGVQVRLEGSLHVLDLAFGDQPVGHQPLGVELQRRLVSLDRLVHQGLGEHRLVTLVVAEPPIAEDVDDDVLVELLAELGRNAGGVHHSFRVVAVDVEDRRLDHERDVGRIGRRARVLRRGREADLVVDDDVDRAAGPVALQTREAEALRDDALPCEGCVAMQQDRQHLGAVDVALLRLLRAHLAEDDRVDRLEVRGVGGEREVHGVAVELAVGGGAEVVLHVAGALDFLGLEAAALELVEDRLVRLLHDVREDAEPAAVRHADDHLLDPEGAAALDDLLHCRDQRLAAVEPEALGAGVLDLQELLETLGLHQLVQDRPAAALGEADLLAVAFDPLLEPGRLLRVGDVHVLEREGAAVGALHQRQDLAQGRGFEAEDVVDEDRSVEIGLGEAVGLVAQLGVRQHLLEAERVEVGLEVAADAVGADDHQRAERVGDCLADLLVRDGDAFFGGLGADLVADGAGRVRPPLAIEGGCQFVVRRRRPVGSRPARTAGAARDVAVRVVEAAEECLPACVDAGRVLGIAGLKLLDVVGVVSLQEGG